MPRVLIIGYGNPLRGDDGLGWRAAEQLREAAQLDTEVLTVHQLTPELAEDVSRAELVVFIDAGEGGAPGSWKHEEIAPDAGGQPFTHHVTPGSLVSAAGTLYGRAPRAVLYSMAGESFEFGEGLSLSVAAALPKMLEEVKATAWSKRR